VLSSFQVWFRCSAVTASHCCSERGLKELLKRHGTLMPAGKIEPADICQGSLGDCWLMSALACLATRDGAVQQVFVTDEYNSYGKYTIKVFDAPRMEWKRIAVDDW
jgi:hypothetical protein